MNRDFHAKPVCACGIVGLQRFHGMTHANNAFPYEEVLLEREAYEKEIAFWQNQQIQATEYGTAQNEALNKEIARAEAAEADVKTLLEQNKVLAEAAEKGGTVFVPIYHQLRLKKAEGRVKKLEAAVDKWASRLDQESEPWIRNMVDDMVKTARLMEAKGQKP